MKRWGRAVSARPRSATRRFWASLPLRAYLLFVAAVFCFFSSAGFVVDITSLGQWPPWAVAFNVVLSGLIASAWVLFATKSAKFIVLALALQVGAALIRQRVAPAPIAFDAAALSTIEQRMRLDAIGLMTAVVVGYVLTIVFITTQGRRYLRVHTEMALASEIHQLLSPPIDRRIDRFAFYGASMPSGEVGGDLIDVVDVRGTWVASIADVSGHGVASGTLMGMFKSAVRSRLAGGSLDTLFTDVNDVIMDLKKANMFVTCAAVAHRSDGTMQFTVAGHLPILHYQHATGAVQELSEPHLPIGMFEGQRYRWTDVSVATGDVFALVTDGLTEVFDRRDEEFGLERLKQVFAANATQDLPALFQAMLAAARQHGPQLDDQSLLLVRLDL